MSRSEALSPPWSLDYEKSTLGSMMILKSDDERFRFCLDTLDSSCFYRPDHRVIFDAISELAAEGAPHDWVTIYEQSNRLRLAEKSGISAEHLRTYLGIMAKDTPSAANVKHYARGVKNSSQLRLAMTRLGELAEMASVADFSDDNVNAVVEEITGFAFDLEQGRVTGDQAMKHLKPILKAKIDDIQARIANPDLSNIKGASTGILPLDERISGLEDGKLIVVAGIPASGKTTLALNCAEHIAITSSKKSDDEMVNIFSVEMTEDELSEKFLSSAGRVDFSHIRSPIKLDENDWVGISKAAKALKDAGIYIDDETNVTPNMIRRKVRASMHKYGKTPRLIVADFLQIMDGDNGPYQNDNVKFGDISRQMKAIAKEFSCPVILVSQLNRESTKRHNPIPIPADLRGSGDIEANATVIVFVHRPAAVAMALGTDEDMSETDKLKASLVCAKVKGGKPGIDEVIFNGHYQRFDAYSPEVEAPGAWT